MQSHDHHPELTLANQLCFALYDASRSIIRAYGPLLRGVGLTFPQYLVMLALWESDGVVSVGELGNLVHLDNGTLTPILKRLAQQGSINRTRDPDDARRVLITLTARGRGLRTQVTAIPAQVYERCGIDNDSGRRLRDTLFELARSLENADAAGS